MECILPRVLAATCSLAQTLALSLPLISSEPGGPSLSGFPFLLNQIEPSSLKSHLPQFIDYKEESSDLAHLWSSCQVFSILHHLNQWGSTMSSHGGHLETYKSNLPASHGN